MALAHEDVAEDLPWIRFLEHSVQARENFRRIACSLAGTEPTLESIIKSAGNERLQMRHPCRMLSRSKLWNPANLWKSQAR